MINKKVLHPNPIFNRNKWLSLNGEWEFSLDTPAYDRIINVPFSWTSKLSGICEDKDGTGYYRKTVEYNYESSRLMLVIGACDYDTEVTVNGKLVATHRGGYTPIKADVTDVWDKTSPNTIEIKATDMSYETQLYGKQGYGNSRGIWQSVYLEECGDVYIKAFTTRTTLDGEVCISVEKGGADIPSVLKASFDGQVYESTDSVVKFKVNNPVLWTMENPHLYYGTISLESSDSTDTVNTYFGIREVGTTKIGGINYITLNGKPVYLNGLLDQSFNSQGHFTLPSDEDCEKEILRFKNTGFNLDRIHIKTEEHLKLYYADKHGVLVMQDVPCFWGEPIPEAKEQFEIEMDECIKRDINHPSIIYWVVFNETWGLKTFNPLNSADWTYTKETQEWVRKCFHRVKELDPTRLVEDNSPCQMDHVETDVNTWHFYFNGYETIRRQIKRYADNHYPGSCFNFIGGNTCGDIPLMNSECGNYWGVVGNSGDSDISWQFKYMLNEFRLNAKNCGFVFTEFHDVENEFNGIYTIDGDLKKNGYDFYVDQMDYKDITSQDYLAIDMPPMSVSNRGELISVPVYISSFTDENHQKNTYIDFECVNLYADGSRKTVYSEKRDINYGYGLTSVGNFDFVAGDEMCITIATVHLMSDNNKVMSNFVLFHNNIAGVSNNVLSVPLTDFETEGFEYVNLCQNNAKLNCIGKGKVRTVINKNSVHDYKDGCDLEIVLEISSRELMTRDTKDAIKGSLDLNLMRGASNDRGANTNSFYMTDSVKVPSNVKILVNDRLLADIDTEDSPADSTGSLSHFYQLSDRLLDEAGSYGYVHSVTIPAEVIKDDEFVFEISTDSSMSIFGQTSGAYPCGVDIRVKK